MREASDFILATELILAADSQPTQRFHAMKGDFPLGHVKNLSSKKKDFLANFNRNKIALVFFYAYFLIRNNNYSNYFVISF